MPDPQLITPGLPPELQAQAYGIRQKQAISNALLAQGNRPLQGHMAGRVYVPVSPLQGFNQALQAGVGGLGSVSAGRDEQQLAQNYQKLLGEEVRRYTDSSPQATMTGNVEEGTQPTTTYHAPDRKQQVVRAITSSFPALQQLGMAEAQAGLKGQITPEDMIKELPKMTQESVAKFMATRDPSVLRLRPEWQVSGDLVSPKHTETSAPPTVTAAQTYPEPKPITTEGPSKGILETRASLTGKPSYSPATVSVSQNVGAEDKRGLKGYETELDILKPRVIESAKVAGAARDTIPTLQAANDMVDRGVKAGLFRDTQAAVPQLLQQFGLAATDDSVANTKLLAAYLDKLVLENSRALGSGTAFSNTDRIFLREMLTGQSMPIEALQELIGHLTVASARVINQHNDLIESSKGMQGFSPDFAKVNRVEVPEFSVTGESLKQIPTAPVGTLRPARR